MAITPLPSNAGTWYPPSACTGSFLVVASDLLLHNPPFSAPSAPMVTHLTPEEEAAIQHLPRATPYLIRNISRTQFSIVRHYNGTVYNGARYFYIPETDELIRTDVLKFIQQRRRAAAKRPAPAETPPLALDP